MRQMSENWIDSARWHDGQAVRRVRPASRRGFFLPPQASRLTVPVLTCRLVVLGAALLFHRDSIAAGAVFHE